MRRSALACCVFVLLTGTGSFGQKSPPVTVSTCLNSFLDLSSLPSYQEGTESAEVSTYDRTGGNDDGFAGTYSFVRRNPDSSLIIFDTKGPGVINRFWTPTPSADTLDFYIDDDRHISFSINYQDLYSGKVFPFIAPLCANRLGGYYCYMPIPFAKSCKIVFRGKRTMFHQIGYRMYPPGTVVRKFTLPLADDEKRILAAIAGAWSKPGTLTHEHFYDQATNKTINDFNLRPGETITTFESVKPGRILGFEIESDAGLGSLARDIDLRITWDEEASPAIYCPLADYFGYAFGQASMQGLLAGTSGNKHYSFFPMPFDRTAKIELISRAKPASGNLHLKFIANFAPVPRDSTKEGKFYANWNRSNPVPERRPYSILDVKGKGHFTGVSLLAQGLRPGITLFFEGDDSTVIDGRTKFHGTGSEDFFNGGWYALLDRWESPLSLPLSGCLAYSIPLCQTGGYRFFVNDKMSFARSFSQTIEHGPEGNRIPADYSSVAYYYCSENNSQPLVPGATNTAIYVADTLEVYPQLTNMRINGRITIDPRWAFGIYSQTVFCTVTDETLLQYDLAGIPAGNYRMLFDYVKGPDACRFSLWQGQVSLSDWIDGAAEKESRVASETVAHISLTNPGPAFSLHFKTNGTKDKFTLSRIILIREVQP